MTEKGSRAGRSAFLVTAGILCRRVAGLVRLRVSSYYFGLHSGAADAFNAAFRISNFLQNLFGEGALSFFVVPSAMAFLALGDVIAAALLQTGRFRHEDALYVWGILAGSAVGLLASTLGRLYASAYYPLRDTRSPLRYALVRVALTTVLGYLFAIPLPRWLGLPSLWGAAGLTTSAGLPGWVKMLLLRRTLNQA